jgi:hypothetical protein
VALDVAPGVAVSVDDDRPGAAEELVTSRHSVAVSLSVADV